MEEEEEDEYYYAGDEEEDEGVDLYECVSVKQENTSPPPPSITPNNQGGDPIILRPGFQVTDNTSYYNLGCLYVLLYAHVKEGHPMPALFSIQSTQYDKPNVQFQFK
jgi:hypothetical protein